MKIAFGKIAMEKSHNLQQFYSRDVFRITSAADGHKVIK